MKTDLVINTSREKEIIDLTHEINEKLDKIKARSGLVHLQVMHTTCSLTTADLDPGTDKDYLTAIQKIFPSGTYHHPHDPSHVGDHIMSSLIGPSITLDVIGGKLALGTWQAVVLIELSGPRARNISMTFIADK